MDNKEYNTWVHLESYLSKGLFALRRHKVLECETYIAMALGVARDKMYKLRKEKRRVKRKP